MINYRLRPSLFTLSKTINPTISAMNIPSGEANGYIFLPKSHTYYHVDYGEIGDDIAHFGFTHSSMSEKFIEFADIPGLWCLGWDTSHYSDTRERWPISEVLKETKRLAEYYDQDKFYKKEEKK